MAIESGGCARTSGSNRSGNGGRGVHGCGCGGKVGSNIGLGIGSIKHAGGRWRGGRKQRGGLGWVGVGWGGQKVAGMVVMTLVTL